MKTIRELRDLLTKTRRDYFCGIKTIEDIEAAKYELTKAELAIKNLNTQTNDNT